MCENRSNGEMAERSMAAVLKTAVPGRVPGVRIPLSPPDFVAAVFRLLATAAAGKPRFARAVRAADTTF
jgi:hypothetical protein